jgi:hypothetical protein
MGIGILYIAAAARQFFKSGYQTTLGKGHK